MHKLIIILRISQSPSHRHGINTWVVGAGPSSISILDSVQVHHEHEWVLRIRIVHRARVLQYIIRGRMRRPKHRPRHMFIKAEEGICILLRHLNRNSRQLRIIIVVVAQQRRWSQGTVDSD
jgi:hypothetical protein